MPKSQKRRSRRASQSRPVRRGTNRRLRVEAELNPQPDPRKLARAVIDLALRQAAEEAAARAEHDEAGP